MLGSCESSSNEDAKIGIGFVFSSNTSRGNEQKAFPNNPGFIDVNRTVEASKTNPFYP